MTGEQWVLECGRGWEEAWRNFWEKNLVFMVSCVYQLYTLNTCSLFYVNDSSLQGSFKIDYSVVRIQSTWMATAKRTHYILFNMPNDPFSYPLRPYRRTEHSRSFRVSWKNERRRASHSPEIWTVWALGGAWLSTSVPRHLLENN